MATYAELFDLRNNTDLRNRVAVAALKKAQALLDIASPTTQQVTWAKTALNDPLAVADQLMGYVLSANSGNSMAQITGATDAQIQTNVNAAADKLLTG